MTRSMVRGKELVALPDAFIRSTCPRNRSVPLLAVEFTVLLSAARIAGVGVKVVTTAQATCGEPQSVMTAVALPPGGLIRTVVPGWTAANVIVESVYVNCVEPFVAWIAAAS
jgi:hypothetical protein